MTIEDALNFIHGTNKFGSVLGLDSIKRLCGRLSNPERHGNFIHIAGTNGKGSVASALSAILVEAGYKTGLYTSPAIESFNERIRVNGRPIDDEALCRLTKKVMTACREITEEGFSHPTEFEIVTAIGLLYYKDMACDYTVLEVGLGGRLDATNVIERPKLCVITSLSMDHTDRLGNTLEKIAREKCGIIKGNVSVITPESQAPEAMKVISNSAKSLTVVSVPKIKEENLSGICFDAGGIENVHFPLAGEHQAENAALAIESAKILGISDRVIKSGIEKTNHPARMEKISSAPLVILDGAHNISAMEYLKKNLTVLLPKGEKTLIIGMLRDKDYEASAALIAPLFDKIITVDIKSERALPKEELCLVMKKYCKTVCSMSLEKACEAINGDGTFVVAGSLYLAGEFKTQYRKAHL